MSRLTRRVEGGQGGSYSRCLLVCGVADADTSGREGRCGVAENRIVGLSDSYTRAGASRLGNSATVYGGVGI